MRYRYLRQVTDLISLEIVAKLDFPSFWAQDSGETAQKRRLSAAVSADDAEIIASVDFVIEIIDNVLVAVTERELAAFYQICCWIHVCFF